MQKDKTIFKTTADWRNLRLYRKSDVLYQLTVVFCRRFQPAYGDRTVDQMVQAARSGKQNIVEGSEDGMTSTESELKLINIARGSIAELREDYEDYAKSHGLPLWDGKHPRFDNMLRFCREHNDFADYAPLASRATAEEFCNVAVTVCRFTDRMMASYLEYLERRFVTEGGIKERMHSARTGFRQEQDARLLRLEEENKRLKELLKQHGIPF